MSGADEFNIGAAWSSLLCHEAPLSRKVRIGLLELASEPQTAGLFHFSSQMRWAGWRLKWIKGLQLGLPLIKYLASTELNLGLGLIACSCEIR